MSNYAYAQDSSTRSLLSQVFAWMSLALAITGITAFFVYSHEATRQLLVTKPGLLIGLLIVQLIVVLAFSFLVYRVSFAVALFLFLFYAFLTGVTLSIIFLAYTMSSIASTFGIAALLFGSMALYGYVTNRDLSSMGSLLSMALWGVIIAMVVNVFLQNTMFNTIISVVAVLLFTGLTAYDVQRIKQIATVMNRNNEEYYKISLVGALTLYLDFINLFLNLLQLTGRRRE